MKFVSRRRKELRVIVKPADRVIDEQRRVTIVPGKKAEFSCFEYSTNDPEMIIGLRNHMNYGTDFAAAGDIDEYIRVYRETGVPPVEKKGQFITPATKTLLAEVVEKAKPEPETALSKTGEPVKLEELVDQRIKVHMDELTKTLTDLILAKDSKPKKVFTCPICKEVFPSGIAVGRHKKEVHG